MDEQQGRKRKAEKGEGRGAQVWKPVRSTICVHYDTVAEVNARMTQYPSDIKLMFIKWP